MTEQLGLFDRGSVFVADLATAPITVRESRRARRLILRLLPPHTLELVVPRGTRPAEVEAFVRAHHRWIERARRELATRYPAGHGRLPSAIELPSIAQSWRVRYQSEPGRAWWRVNGDCIDVAASERDFRGAGALLRSWLLEQARVHLRPWIMREAEIVGRRPKAVQVRLQRTRWGSCSSVGNISLNAGLLFLDDAVVRYLLIHELCHLFSLNHSQRFWRAVARFEPDYRALDRRLTESWARIPLWAHAGQRGGDLAQGAAH